MNRSRANRKRNQDLELRLGRPEPHKAGTLVVNQNSGSNAPIVVEDDDDDDDVQLSSPRSFAQARSIVSRRTVRMMVMNEDDLELRLGIAGTQTSAGRIRASVNRNGCFERSEVLENKTIDICDDGEEDDRKCSKKRKHGLPLSYNTSVQVKEIKLTCAICMDSMKEETSTVCGHIFCKNCITNAIQFQKKCPTCRRKLSNNNIHRIYLPSTST